ncbi:MAG: hypothetical protein AVDCRST_MAG18-490, partial [uncultured Thermomicrobiales bacterium]
WRHWQRRCGRDHCGRGCRCRSPCGSTTGGGASSWRRAHWRRRPRCWWRAGQRSGASSRRARCADCPRSRSNISRRVGGITSSVTSMRRPGRSNATSATSSRPPSGTVRPSPISTSISTSPSRPPGARRSRMWPISGVTPAAGTIRRQSGTGRSTRCASCATWPRAGCRHSPPRRWPSRRVWCWLAGRCGVWRVTSG